MFWLTAALSKWRRPDPMNSATPADSVAVAARSGSEITVPNESNGRIPFGAILPVRRAGWTAFETTWQGRIGWVSWSSVETPEVAARSVSTAIADAPSAALYETRALLFAHLGRIDAAVADYDSVFKLAPA
ncbi:MAG TPA: hypothetical protein VGE52_21430, partial [Pirellulales bacterium]